MVGYAQYLQKISDLLAREEILTPNLEDETVQSIHRMSYILDQVIEFSVQTNFDINSLLFKSVPSEDILRSQLFLEFQQLIDERERQRVSELDYEEYLHDAGNEEDLHDSYSIDEMKNNQDNFELKTNTTEEVKKEDLEDVVFVVEDFGISATGVDDYGLDIYGSIPIEKFNEIVAVSVTSNVLRLDDNITIKPFVSDLLQLSGSDSYRLDIYGDVAISLFEVDNINRENVKNPEKLAGLYSVEPVDDHIIVEDKLPSENTVVTIQNRPISAEELDSLVNSSQELETTTTDSFDEEELSADKYKVYPKDIQDSDNIIELISKVENKIGGFFRGFSKKE